MSYAHFTGQRRWTDAQLADAITCSRTWADVTETLGLVGGSSTVTLKGHSARLGLDVSHLSPQNPSREQDVVAPDRRNLSRAGSMLAAAWFELAGAPVSWPLEPTRYDLLVAYQQRLQRIQVKTTITQDDGGYIVYISNSGTERRVYDPDEIDQFFIVDGDLAFYLIPVAAVGGLTALRLAAYSTYRLPSY